MENYIEIYKINLNGLASGSVKRRSREDVNFTSPALFSK